MTRRRRILLVDDEPRIVDALQRFLRRHRDCLEVDTATSGQEALAAMETTHFDVLVTDMRMPEMDGATLLTIAKQRSPATMRIVLSGQTDNEAALRVVPIAHQFLSKPTDPAVLFTQVMRLAATHDSISDPRVRAAVGAIDALPTAVGTYHELGRLLADERTTMAEIARVVEREPPVVVKLLQLVNSAFFGIGRRIVNVPDALAYLGTELVRSLVLSVGVASTLPVRASRFDVDAFYSHALSVGRMAKHIDGSGDRSQVGFVASLLHDVGCLVMASTLPDAFDAIASRAAASGCTQEEAESESLGCRTTQMGAALLDMWGLPYPIVEAIVSFQDARATATTELRAADVVYLAHRLVGAANHDFSSDEDREYLARLGISAKLSGFRDYAASLRSIA